MFASVESCSEELGGLHGRISPLFPRSESRSRALRYPRAPLLPVGRENGWPLAEATGDAVPDGAQALLNGPGWDPGAAQGVLREYVGESLASPPGVLVVGETGFPRRGARSVGVKRQRRGTADRVENRRAGAFLAYASERGAAPVGRAPCLPKERAQDEGRRKDAGARWRVEPCFEEARGECGLDECGAGRWLAWRRHVTLPTLAHAALAAVRPGERERGDPGKA